MFVIYVKIAHATAIAIIPTVYKKLLLNYSFSGKKHYVYKEDHSYKNSDEHPPRKRSKFVRLKILLKFALQEGHMPPGGDGDWGIIDNF